MKKRTFLMSVMLCVMAFPPLFAQQTFDLGFIKDTTLKVYDMNNQELTLAMAGGTNSSHFSEMDLNFDGVMDLVSFDSHGDIVKTYINNGTAGQISYSYAPEYAEKFPKMYGWMKLRDFNCDGKMDLFTYGFAGIKVYENVSNPTDGIKWSLYTPILNAYQSGGVSNILVTSVDYPTITDIDGDSDLDVLVFFGLGSLIKLYKNYSMEDLGTCDTMKMALEHNCWGWVAESDLSNSLTLALDTVDPTIIPYCVNVPMMQKSFGQDSKSPKHTGSTMLAIDLDGDNDKDLILGDVDFPNVVGLFNGGNQDSAYFVSQDTLYPSSDTSIWIYSLASTDFIDVDNDNVKDLIASVMEPAWEVPKAENVDNVWFYKNMGTNSFPNFKLQRKDFLQGDMIDVGAHSYPTFVDYNSDGLLDMVIGNYGTRDSSYYGAWGALFSTYTSNLTLLENTGTANEPAFKIVDEDFGGIKAHEFIRACPTFGDIDGDGDDDMLLGDSLGQVHFFRNTAGAGNVMNLVLDSINYQSIDVGRAATPQLFDLDNDSLLDLIIGYRGKRYVDSFGIPFLWRVSLKYYRNTGTKTNPVFTLITDTLGGIDVRDSYTHYYTAHSAPQFFRDTTGTTRLFVGAGNGLLFYYRDIDSNLNGVFGIDSNMTFNTPYDNFYSVQQFENNDQVQQTINEKLMSTPAVADLNNDGYPDLMVGNYLGGLTFYKGVSPGNIGISEPTTDIQQSEFNLYPNPAQNQVFIAMDDVFRSDKINIRVYTITGREVISLNFEGDDLVQLNTANLQSGIYFIKVDIIGKSLQKTGTKKLIIVE